MHGCFVLDGAPSPPQHLIPRLPPPVNRVTNSLEESGFKEL